MSIYIIEQKISYLQQMSQRTEMVEGGVGEQRKKNMKGKKESRKVEKHNYDTPTVLLITGACDKNSLPCSTQRLGSFWLKDVEVLIVVPRMMSWFAHVKLDLCDTTLL